MKNINILFTEQKEKETVSGKLETVTSFQMTRKRLRWLIIIQEVSLKY